MKTKRYALNTEDCVAALVALGCGEDDVTVLHRNANFRYGEQVALSSLDEFQFLLSPHTAEKSAHEIPASKVQLSFYAAADGVVVEASLQDMLIDRLRMYRGLDRIIKKPKLRRSRVVESVSIRRVRP